MTDVYATVIGSGVIGTAIGYELSRMTDEPVVLIDKNPNFPGENQTSRNSGVIHSGVYYHREKSPLKAKLCVEGNKLLYDFCEENNVPSRKTGKLIIATNEQEDGYIDKLLINSRKNRVPGVEKIDSERVGELEENVEAYSALWIPTAGIVEPTALTKRLYQLSGLEGHTLLGTEVKKITPRKDEFILKVSTDGNEEEFTTRYIFNAAGLYGDEVARMANPDFELTTFPVRGEFAKFYQSRDDLNISRNVYPTPIFYKKPDGTDHLTVGVHLTPTFSVDTEGKFEKDSQGFKTGREVMVGPLNRKRGEEVGKEDFGGDLESPGSFYEKIKDFFPGINPEDLSLHQTGIQSVLANSSDLHIAPDKKHPRMINSVGICSPGLTASLAAAKRATRYPKTP